MKTKSIFGIFIFAMAFTSCITEKNISGKYWHRKRQNVIFQSHLQSPYRSDSFNTNWSLRPQKDVLNFLYK